MNPLLRSAGFLSWIVCLFVVLATMDKVPDEPAVFKSGRTLLSSLQNAGCAVLGADQPHSLSSKPGRRDAVAHWTALPAFDSGSRLVKSLPGLRQAADPSPPFVFV